MGMGTRLKFGQVHILADSAQTVIIVHYAHLQLETLPSPSTPASPATSSVGSRAQQPLMTPEDSEAYLRKRNELHQRYAHLLSKWITRLSQSQGDNRRDDQIVRLKSLYNVLSDEQRRVPLATLMKCEAALIKMFDQPKEKESTTTAENAQSAQVSLRQL